MEDCYERKAKKEREAISHLKTKFILSYCKNIYKTLLKEIKGFAFISPRIY